jgi:hypothetical protein
MLLKVFIDFCPEKRAIALQDLLDSVDKAWLISTAKYRGVNNLFRFIEEHS